MKNLCSSCFIATFITGISFNAMGAAQKPIGCLIQPDQVAEVGSPVIGIVESMRVERGDSVSKGQVLAILRNEVDRASLGAAHSRAQAEADVHAANANLIFAKQRLTRAQELHAKKFISTQALDQTAAETEVAQQKLAQAQEQQRILAKDATVAKARLDDRTIRSPLDGIVTERYISVGERVEERPLVRVAKVDPLRVEVIMPSSLFGSVAVGAMAQITPDFAGAPALSAKIVLVDKVLDAASGTFRVRLELPNPDQRIPAGLRCKSDFSTANLSPEKAPAPRAGNDANLKPAGLKLDWELTTPSAPNAPLRTKM